jgi:hypothetical protein
MIQACVVIRKYKQTNLVMHPNIWILIIWYLYFFVFN